MRLEQYLNERSDYSMPSGRVKPLTLEEFTSLAKKHCTHSIKAAIKGSFIYRGDRNDGIFFYGDGSMLTAPRVSRNTSNYYTLWIDNHPDWSKYPRRSKSFICSTDQEYASGFGNSVKIILPYDNVNIGVCSNHDFWGSFNDTLPDGTDMSDFNDYIEKILQRINGKMTSYDTDWNTLKSAIKDADAEFSPEQMKETVMGRINSNDNRFYVASYSVDRIESMLNKIIQYGSIWKFMEYTLNPSHNRFKVVKSGDTGLLGDYEVWMEGPILMFEWDDYKKIEGAATVRDFLEDIINS